MTIKIDIVGIGDRKVAKPVTRMDTMDEYLLIAKKSISSYAPKIRYGLAEEMLENDDAVANIAHAIMMADWQFDGRGNRFGFRKERAIYAIKSYITRRKRESAKSVYRLDNIIDSNNSNSTFSAFLVDPSERPSEQVSRNDFVSELVNKMDRMVDNGLLSERGVSFIKMHYMKEMPMSEIANKEGISRQAVHDVVSRTLKIMRNSVQEDNFLGV